MNPVCLFMSTEANADPPKTNPKSMRCLEGREDCYCAIYLVMFCFVISFIEYHSNEYILIHLQELVPHFRPDVLPTVT